jgi:hypothetical protein
MEILHSPHPLPTQENATGGTPYKAYLRKHRDESQAHQMPDLGDDLVRVVLVYMCVQVISTLSCTLYPLQLWKWRIPSREEDKADLDLVSARETVNGIPPHLLVRALTINWHSCSASFTALASQERHADIIAKHGRGSQSLQKKSFPTDEFGNYKGRRSFA